MHSLPPLHWLRDILKTFPAEICSISVCLLPLSMQSNPANLNPPDSVHVCVSCWNPSRHSRLIIYGANQCFARRLNKQLSITFSWISDHQTCSFTFKCFWELGRSSAISKHLALNKVKQEVVSWEVAENSISIALMLVFRQEVEKVLLKSLPVVCSHQLLSQGNLLAISQFFFFNFISLYFMRVCKFKKSANKV